MPARRFIKNDPEELAAYIKSLATGLVVTALWFVIFWRFRAAFDGILFGEARLEGERRRGATGGNFAGPALGRLRAVVLDRSPHLWFGPPEA